jgi:uncharacterized membrane protein YqgA involved in biofilm formation
MTGTLINVVTVLLGGSIGLFFGSRISDRFRNTVVVGIGLFTLALGVKMFLDTENPLISLGSILIGGLLGEWWNIEKGIKNLGAALEERFTSPTRIAETGSNFVRGFLTATLLFEIGPMTILGSIQDGLFGDFNLLAIKSVMDGFAALALASTLGLGVLFSVISVLIYQGSISLLASQAQAILNDAMIAEMTAVGGILLLGLAVGSLLELRSVRTGNLLPALLLAPLIVWIVESANALFGW